jgi:hypothetical protein
MFNRMRRALGLADDRPATRVDVNYTTRSTPVPGASDQPQNSPGQLKDRSRAGYATATDVPQRRAPGSVATGSPEIASGAGPSGRLAAPVVIDSRTASGAADRPATVGVNGLTPRVATGSLPYGVSPAPSRDITPAAGAPADSGDSATRQAAPKLTYGDR